MVGSPTKEWFEQRTFWQISRELAGGTFIDWSINYLLDIKNHTVASDIRFRNLSVPPTLSQTQPITIEPDLWQRYFLYNAATDTNAVKAAIPENPLLHNGLAHGHKKNHPTSIGDALWQSYFLYNNNPTEFNTLYMSIAANDENLDELINFFQANPTIPHVILEAESWTEPFFHLRKLQSIQTKNELASPELSSINFPFEVNLAQPTYLLREQIAIEYASRRKRIKYCYNQNQITDNLKLSFKMSLSDIFENLDCVLLELSKKYKILNFNPVKFEAWRAIYKHWQETNSDIQWFKHLPTVINSIINKQDQLTLVSDLTPLQEMLIESELMLAGWSIKNYNLDKFPSDLRSLELEPLLHSIN